MPGCVVSQARASYWIKIQLLYGLTFPHKGKLEHRLGLNAGVIDHIETGFIAVARSAAALLLVAVRDLVHRGLQVKALSKRTSRASPTIPIDASFFVFLTYKVSGVPPEPTVAVLEERWTPRCSISSLTNVVVGAPETEASNGFGPIPNGLRPLSFKNRANIPTASKASLTLAPRTNGGAMGSTGSVSLRSSLASWAAASNS